MKFEEAVEKYLTEGPIGDATRRLAKFAKISEVDADKLLSNIFDILSNDGLIHQYTGKYIDMMEDLAEILISSKDDPREIGQKIQDSKYSKEYKKMKKQVIDDLMNLV